MRRKSTNFPILLSSYHTIKLIHSQNFWYTSRQKQTITNNKLECSSVNTKKYQHSNIPQIEVLPIMFSPKSPKIANELQRMHVSNTIIRLFHSDEQNRLDNVYLEGLEL